MALQTAEIWINVLVPFFAIMELVAPLSNILSCQVIQYDHLDTLNVQICPLLMQWATAVGLEKMLQTENGEWRTKNGEQTENQLQNPL